MAEDLRDLRPRRGDPHLLLALGALPQQGLPADLQAGRPRLGQHGGQPHRHHRRPAPADRGGPPTGHAVLSAKDKMHEEHETIMVLSTDQPHISKETILNLLKTHLEKKSTITIATVMLPDFEDWREGIKNLGRIVRDKNGKVSKIVEYKDATDKEKEITEINPAVYVFEQNWLWENINKIKNENTQKEYYLTDLLHLAHQQGKKIEAVPVSNILEGLQPNSKEELEILEGLIS